MKYLTSVVIRQLSRCCRVWLRSCGDEVEVVSSHLYFLCSVFLAFGRFAYTMDQAIKPVIDPLINFAKESQRLLVKCEKPTNTRAFRFCDLHFFSFPFSFACTHMQQSLDKQLWPAWWVSVLLE